MANYPNMNQQPGNSNYTNITPAGYGMPPHGPSQTPPHPNIVLMGCPNCGLRQGFHPRQIQIGAVCPRCGGLMGM